MWWQQLKQKVRSFIRNTIQTIKHFFHPARPEAKTQVPSQNQTEASNVQKLFDQIEGINSKAIENTSTNSQPQSEPKIEPAPNPEHKKFKKIEKKRRKIEEDIDILITAHKESLPKVFTTWKYYLGKLRQGELFPDPSYLERHEEKLPSAINEKLKAYKDCITPDYLKSLKQDQIEDHMQKRKFENEVASAKSKSVNPSTNFFKDCIKDFKAPPIANLTQVEDRYVKPYRTSSKGQSLNAK